LFKDCLWPLGISNLTVQWIVMLTEENEFFTKDCQASLSFMKIGAESYFVSSHKWIFPHTLHISWLMWVKFDIEHLYAVSLSCCDFVKICAFKSILYFRAWMKFCQHFLHYLFDVDSILCRSWLIVSSLKTILHLWVWCESVCTMSVFFIVGKARLGAVKTN